MNQQTILSCKNLTKSFVDGKREISVLRGVDFSIDTNQSAAIIGVSGSGKSTLLHLLGGLEQPTSGQVFWRNQEISMLSEKQKCQFRNQHLGFVYQFHHLLPEFSALENVAIPLLIGGESTKKAQKKASDILARVGLKARLEHKPSELSGGECQRVAIARALVTCPRCVLADEPTGNLDSKTAEKVFNMMLELQTELGISFVVVTHNQELAQKMQVCYDLKNGILSINN